jgi:putative ABC transport system permease protein
MGIDLREVVRRIRRAPGVAALAVLTLALGIGANTAMFSVIRTVLLEPLPYADAGRLVMLWHATDRDGTTWLSIPEVESYRRDLASLERVAAYTEGEANLTSGDEPERVRAAQVTPDLFEVLGTPPALGRGFTAAAGRPGGDALVVLGHGLWQRRFGGAAAIVGQQVEINGRLHTVAGIMPAGFQLPMDYRRDRPTELWLPFVIDPANPGEWGSRLLLGVGRLRPGVAAAAATSELEVLWRRWITAGFIAKQADGRSNRAAIPLAEMISGGVRTPLLILLATVACVLLIALANVANLWLSQAVARSRELAIRSALGAERWRLIRQMLVESVLLAALGGVLGLALALALVRVLATAHAGTLPRIEQAELGPALLAFTLALSVLAGVLFGLAPAIQLSRPSLSRAINDSSRAATAGRGTSRLRQALVVGQMLLSVVLLLAAGLLLRSLVALNRVPLGFETANLLTARVQVAPAGYPDAAAVIRFYRELDQRLADIPGVQSAGLIRILPLSRTIGNWSITLDHRAYSPAENPNGDYQYVTPGYFEAMRIQPLRGRLVGDGDTEDAPLVVVINDTMARKYWPGEDAIGRRFHFGTADQPWLTIVGIVPTLRHNAVVEEPRAEMYVPHAQVSRARAGTPRSMAVVVQTADDPASYIPALRAAVRAIDPKLPVAEIRTMTDIAAGALARPRLTTWLLAGFAALALALAAIGIYGTSALLVSDRAQEIGIRLALGAPRAAILRLVLARGVALAAAGIAGGVVAALALTRLLTNLLYGVTPLDPLTFVAVPALLGGVALLASLVPARRAARLDPLRTLRK